MTLNVALLTQSTKPRGGVGAAFTADGYDTVHAQDCISANGVGSCVRTIHHLDQFTTPVLAKCHEQAIVEPYAHICVSAAVADEVAARERWRGRLGNYLPTVGAIETRKGTTHLVEANHILQQRFPELSLVIAGGETLFAYRDYRA